MGNDDPIVNAALPLYKLDYYSTVSNPVELLAIQEISRLLECVNRTQINFIKKEAYMYSTNYIKIAYIYILQFGLHLFRVV